MKFFREHLRRTIGVSRHLQHGVITLDNFPILVYSFRNTATMVLIEEVESPKASEHKDKGNGSSFLSNSSSDVGSSNGSRPDIVGRPDIGGAVAHRRVSLCLYWIVGTIMHPGRSAQPDLS